ncbi:MAG: glycosyltransferase [Candidatus Neomarinimicrobiota bacterium]
MQLVGEGSLRDEYERLAATLGLEDVVSFQGAMTKVALAEEMRACDFLVLPSQFEAFGAVLIEALAGGKPVIATDRGGPAEFINGDVGLRVPPGNSGAPAQAMDEVLDHHRHDQIEACPLDPQMVFMRRR